VQEITVDGDVVFSAGPSNLPVAYSNLIAWYPFDSATYGGANADDVTAILGGSGDDTAYNGTLNGPSYASSGGVTDINAGANSGAFEFDRVSVNSGDFIDLGNNFSETSHTKCCWFKTSITTSEQRFFGGAGGGNDKFTNITLNRNANNEVVYIFDNGVQSFDEIITGSFSANTYTHVAITYDASSSSNNCELYIDGVSQGTDSQSSGLQMLGDTTLPETIGVVGGDESDPLDGFVDDARIYNKALTTGEIEDIVENTQDPNNPVFP
jgi:hypothetical protein